MADTLVTVVSASSISNELLKGMGTVMIDRALAIEVEGYPFTVPPCGANVDNKADGLLVFIVVDEVIWRILTIPVKLFDPLFVVSNVTTPSTVTLILKLTEGACAVIYDKFPCLPMTETSVVNVPATPDVTNVPALTTGVIKVLATF